MLPSIQRWDCVRWFEAVFYGCVSGVGLEGFDEGRLRFNGVSEVGVDEFLEYG